MRIARGEFQFMLALLLGAAGAAASLSPATAWSAAKPASSAAILRPLSEADQMSTREMGCTCTFGRGRQTLVQAIGNELMVRTAAGRQVCRISDAQFQKVAGGNGRAACGGVQMSFRLTGRTRTFIESDSSETPAALTLSQGKRQGKLVGSWSCAC